MTLDKKLNLKEGASIAVEGVACALDLDAKSAEPEKADAVLLFARDASEMRAGVKVSIDETWSAMRLKDLNPS